MALMNVENSYFTEIFVFLLFWFDPKVSTKCIYLVYHLFYFYLNCHRFKILDFIVKKILIRGSLAIWKHKFQIMPSEKSRYLVVPFEFLQARLMWLLKVKWLHLPTSRNLWNECKFEFHEFHEFRKFALK